MAYSLKQGLITDWETTRRNERHGFNLVCLLASLMTLFLLYQFGDAFLMRLFLIFVFLILTYSLITLFWKISGHMTANTAFVLVLNVLFDWRFCWLVFLLPLVAWARMVRNKHDIWQILGGVALSSLVILLGNYALF